MKQKKRNVAEEIIADLKKIKETLCAGTPLSEKFTVRTVRVVPKPAESKAKDVRRSARGSV